MNLLKYLFGNKRKFGQTFDKPTDGDPLALYGLNDLRNECHRVVEEFEREIRGMGRSGFIDGLFGAKLDHRALPSTLQHHIRRGEGKLNAIGNLADRREKELLVDYNKYKEDQANSHNRLAKHKSIAVDPDNLTYDLERKKEKLEEDKKELVEKKNRLRRERYNGSIPEETLFDKSATLIITGLAICVLEYPFTKYPLDNLVKADGSAMFLNGEAGLLALLLSIFLSVSAKMGGHAIARKRYIEGMIAFLPGLAICAGILWLRGNEYLVFGLLPFVFFLAYALISYSYYRNAEWFSTVRSLKKVDKELTKVGHELARRNLQAEQTFAIEELKGEEHLTTRSEYIDKALQSLANIKEEYTSKIQSVFADGWYSYVKPYERFRSLRGGANLPDCPKLKTSDDPGQSNGQTQLFPVLNSLLVLVVCGVLVSCSPPSSHSLAIVVDQTVDLQVDPSDLANHIQNDMYGGENLNLRSPIDVSVWTIGENSRQKRVGQITLQEGPGWAFRNDDERRREIKGFFDDLDTLLSAAIAHKDTLAYSFVYENIAAPLEYLAGLPAETSKSILVLSDGLQHTPDLSWYRGLPVPDDYEETAQHFLSYRRLPSLAGISMSWYFVPDRSNDQAFNAAFNFFEWLYETQGAKVDDLHGL